MIYGLVLGLASDIMFLCPNCNRITLRPSTKMLYYCTECGYKEKAKP